MATPRVPMKRKRVSVNDKTQEVADPKRKRILLSTDLKTQTYKFWYDAMIAISNLYDDKTEKIFTDVSWSCQIMAVFYSAHNMCRQIGNGTKTDESLTGKQAAFKYGGQEYSKALKYICEKIRAIAGVAGLVYKKYTTNTSDNWISIASAVFSFAQNFKNRMKEVRVGHSKIQVGKSENEMAYVAAQDYGLEQPHHVLLEGSSYPPHVKSSVAQSLGPATLMIMVLEKGNETKYGEKWREALLQSLGTLPDKDMFIKCLTDTGINQNKALISLVCDILLLTSTRQIHRAYLAPCFLMVIFSKAVDCPEAMETSSAPKREFDDQAPKRFNNTGRGLFASYINKLHGKSFTLNTALTASQASQFCFHAMFGTYLDNLNVLKEITNVGNWDTRNQFGDKIKGIGCGEPQVCFKLPMFKLWAKLCTAMQTKLLGGNIQEIMPNPSFTGPQINKWNKTLSGYYKEKLTSTTAYSKPANSQALKEKYTLLLAELVSGIEEKGKIERGSTSWHKVTSAQVSYENDPDGNDLDKVDTVIDVPIKLFLSGDQVQD